MPGFFVGQRAYGIRHRWARSRLFSVPFVTPAQAGVGLQNYCNTYMTELCVVVLVFLYLYRLRHKVIKSPSCLRRSDNRGLSE